MREGARRVWRHQRVLWWLLFVNFVLGALGTIPMASRVGSAADHSLHSQVLSDAFDLPAFLELASNPDVALWSKTTDSIWFALIFFFFALFLTGGILETYRADRKLTSAEFFEACGAYFWRWIRLVVYLLMCWHLSCFWLRASRNGRTNFLKTPRRRNWGSGLMCG